MSRSALIPNEIKKQKSEKEEAMHILMSVPAGAQITFYCDNSTKHLRMIGNMLEQAGILNKRNVNHLITELYSEATFSTFSLAVAKCFQAFSLILLKDKISQENFEAAMTIFTVKTTAAGIAEYALSLRVMVQAGIFSFRPSSPVTPELSDSLTNSPAGSI